MVQVQRRLRPYQKDYLKALNQAIENGERHILAVLSTGAGKTDIACSFIKQAKKEQKTTLFIVHTKELVDNAHARLDKYYTINATFIKAGYPFDPHNLVKVCSIQTLSKMKDMPHADYVFWDEAHRCEAQSYQKILAHYKDAVHIGLTATWFRGDGSGLGDTFDFIIHLVKYRDLLKREDLSPTRIYVPDTVDMKGVETIGGEYNSTQMAVRFSKKEILASNVRNYLKHAKGRKVIAYNCNVAHSKATCAYFNKQGIPSAHIDGKMKREEREQILANFEAGKYLVLHNVNIFTEGFDSPDVSCIILNRAMKSKTLYIQMTGRGVRVIDGYIDCVVLDFGDNARKFGKIEDYDIDGATLFVEKPEEKKVSAPLKCCPECKLMNPVSVNECIECGYSFKEADEAERIRVEMELVEFEQKRNKWKFSDKGQHFYDSYSRGGRYTLLTNFDKKPKIHTSALIRCNNCGNEYCVKIYYRRPNVANKLYNPSSEIKCKKCKGKPTVVTRLREKLTKLPESIEKLNDAALNIKKSDKVTPIELVEFIKMANDATGIPQSQIIKEMINAFFMEKFKKDSSLTQIEGYIKESILQNSRPPTTTQI